MTVNRVLYAIIYYSLMVGGYLLLCYRLGSLNAFIDRDEIIKYVALYPEDKSTSNHAYKRDNSYKGERERALYFIEKNRENLRKSGVYESMRNEYLDSVKIEPIYNWPAVLEGKWTIDYHTDFVDYQVDINGNFDFQSGGTYFAYLKIEYSRNNLNSHLASGGRVDGNWVVTKDSILHLTTTACNLSISKNKENIKQFDPCRIVEKLEFGSFKNNEGVSSTIRFSDKVLKFQEKNYASDSKTTITFQRNADK